MLFYFYFTKNKNFLNEKSIHKIKKNDVIICNKKIIISFCYTLNLEYMERNNKYK